MTTIDLLYIRPRGGGWGPVHALAALSARVLDARLITLEDGGSVGALSKLEAFLPRRRGAGRALLVLAPNPAHLAYTARMHPWFRRYDSVVAWVIDSFWTDWTAGFARRHGQFDHIFITDRDLRDQWHDLTGTSIHWAPWGTDTQAVPEALPARSYDLVRLGRQPPAWQDDAYTARVCASVGLHFSGAPPVSRDTVTNQDSARSALLSSKFALAFSNLVSPASYTHPTREYLTARWMDALAAGATVAGTAPASAAYTLWPGATVEIEPGCLKQGIRQVVQAVAEWEPGRAAGQIAMARERLDWRLRLHQIVIDCGWPMPGSLASAGASAQTTNHLERK